MASNVGGSRAPLRIVIAGGGTAGWMAAAAFGRFLEHGFDVRLVESDAIGAVGVGESTIPQMRTFNHALGLDEDAMLRACGGTFKLGIEFVGWGAPDERYMHAFGDIGRDVGLIPFQHYWQRARAAGLAAPLGAYSLNETAARTRRMHRGAPATASVPPMPYAFHIDAGRYAAWLRRFAEARGVVRTEGRIVAVEREGDGVAAVLLEAGERITGDLFLDCTGFRALLIEGALGVGFEGWAHWLPCDRAVALPTASHGDLVPYTQAIAMPAGWRWRIPLQHRVGNGHVYASAFMDDEAALAGLLAAVDGAPLAEPNRLRFAAGRRRAAWAGNVVAMGLASGFLEPLESTSIYLVQSAIARLLKLLPGHTTAAAQRREYNRQTDFELEAVRDFIILHYHANRRDEPFWRAVRAQPLPDSLATRIDLYRSTGHIVREHEELFTEVGWLQVLEGQGLAAAAYSPLADMIAEPDLAEYMATIPALYAREAQRYPAHADFIARHCAAR
ncbi:tryptophan 7-halogenase (plasmid) [Polymorphobacter sp. PAMC 29334]|uniref:tryptophan halogenase family protein n=1 Tax=Polymorphobacter sp. PAMC 29334 TaxID=2862331 RepID=UPI001C663B77|nr:tryptophan halogenase family protein [Polymorphobacter sp. PAMC 29334]QYE37092.1 tryptophan 7-halogenase [Polymorphobacter sp. PAMC 29334]